MTLKFSTKASPVAPWVSLDTDVLGIHSLRLRIGYSHPSEMSFKMVAEQHTLPLGLKQAIVMWDDSVHTFTNPTFEGFIEEISPMSNTYEVEVTCYDPTRKVTSDIQLMSAAWSASPAPGIPPQEAIGAVPRLILNCTIDKDDDFAFCRAFNQTVGQTISIMFDDALAPLRYIHAAPSAGLPYIQSQMNSMDYIPQEKLVFESESIRSGIDRMLTMYPAVRFVFVPGESNRTWQLINVLGSPQQTLTLNKFTVAGPNVLGLDLKRSLEGRKTAVKIYGPETILTETIETANLEPNDDGLILNNGSLTGIIGTSIILETYSDATGFGNVVRSWRQFQVADPTKRRSANTLNITYLAGLGDYNWMPVRHPVLEVSFDNGNTWMSVPGTIVDNQNGIVEWVNFMYFWTDKNPPASTRNFWTPTNYRWTHAYYVEPLSTRWPPSGFSGSAYDLANMQIEDKIYDEMLSTGWDQGVPVTTASRIQQYTRLTRSLQEQSRDIAYVGGCVIEGIDYSFLRLDRRINFAAVDENGVAKITGWENINAILTDVEYRYGEEDTTILTFSSDQMELIGLDIELLKDRLNVRALEFIKIQLPSRILTLSTTKSFGGHTIPGNQALIFNEVSLFFDPISGLVEEPIFPPGL